MIKSALGVSGITLTCGPSEPEWPNTNPAGRAGPICVSRVPRRVAQATQMDRLLFGIGIGGRPAETSSGTKARSALYSACQRAPPEVSLGPSLADPSSRSLLCKAQPLSRRAARGCLTGLGGRDGFGGGRRLLQGASFPYDAEGCAASARRELKQQQQHRPTGQLARDEARRRLDVALGEAEGRPRRGLACGATGRPAAAASSHQPLEDGSASCGNLLPLRPGRAASGNFPFM